MHRIGEEIEPLLRLEDGSVVESVETVEIDVAVIDLAELHGNSLTHSTASDSERISHPAVRCSYLECFDNQGP